MGASSQLRALARDLQQAGSGIYDAAGQVVHASANQVEASIRAIDGTSSQVVVTYPGATAATIRGVRPYGVSQDAQPVQIPSSVDIAGVIDSMVDGVTDAGVKLITGAS